MPIKQATPSNYTYDQDESAINGLDPSSDYKVSFTDGTDSSFTSDENGVLDISSKANMTLNGIVLKGNQTTSVDSDVSTINPTKLIWPREETPNASFNQTSGLLTDLTANSTYTVTYTALGQTQEQTFEFTTASGVTSYDLASDSRIAGKTLVSLVKKGDKTSTSNSYPQTDLSKAVLPRESVPSASFNSVNGDLTGLVSSGDYSVFFTDSTNVSFTLDASSTSYNLSDNDNAVNKTIASIVKNGDNISKIDSLKQTDVNSTVLTRYSTPASVQEDDKGVISHLSASTTYILTDNSSQTYTVTSDSQGKITVSLNENTTLIGKTLTGIKVKGDSSNAESKSQVINYTLPAREITPSGEFDQITGELTNLSASSTYKVSFTDGTYLNFTLNEGQTSYNLSDDTNASNKTIASIIKTAVEGTSLDSEAQTSITSKVLPRADTPSGVSQLSQDKTQITGLDSEVIYILTDSKGDTFIKTSDSKGIITVDKDTNSDLLGLTITSIVKQGETDISIDSKSLEVNITLPSVLSTPNASYQNGTISGLESNRLYTLIDSDGKTYSIKADSEGRIITLNHTELYEKTITSIVEVKNNDNSQLDSDNQTVLFKMPIKENTPNSSFNSETSAIQGLEISYDYTLIDKDGNSYSVTSSSTGSIDILDHDDLIGKDIVQIIKKGNKTTTYDSSAQTVDYQLFNHEELVTKAKEDAKDDIEKYLDENVEDGSQEMKELLEEIKASLDQENMENLTTAQIKARIAALISKSQDQIDFLAYKDQAKEEINNMGRTCQDDKLHSYVEQGIKEVGETVFGQQTTADIDSIVETTKDKIANELHIDYLVGQIDKTLQSQTEAAKLPEGYKQAAEKITASYKEKIISASSKEESDRYYAEYLDELASLKASYYSGEHCYYHYIDMAFLASYLIFFIVYIIIFKHFSLDNVSLISLCLFFIATAFMSFNVGCSICLGLIIASWLVIIASILFLVLSKKFKKTNSKAGLTKDATQEKQN